MDDSDKPDPAESTWSLPPDSSFFFTSRDENPIPYEFPSWNSYNDSSELSHGHSNPLESTALADVKDFQPSDALITDASTSSTTVVADASSSAFSQSLVGDRSTDVVAPASSSSSEDLADKHGGKVVATAAAADTS